MALLRISNLQILLVVQDMATDDSPGLRCGDDVYKN